MNKINSNIYKQKRTFIPIILLALLIVFSVLLFLVTKQTYENKRDVDSYTIATKIDENENGTDGELLYSPKFYYDVNGIEYVCNTAGSSSVRPTKSKAKIYYNSQNPSKCVSEYELSIANLVVIMISVVFIVLFSSLLMYTISTIKANIRLRSLCKNGQLIRNLPCTITEPNLAINNRNGYYIEVEFKTYDGEVLYLKSNMKFDRKNISKKTADILIDPRNTKNYFIDFEL